MPNFSPLENVNAVALYGVITIILKDDTRLGRTPRALRMTYQSSTWVCGRTVLHLVVAQASKRQWRFKSFRIHLLTRDSEVECLTVNQVVVGSIPTESAIGSVFDTMKMVLCSNGYDA